MKLFARAMKRLEGIYRSVRRRKRIGSEEALCEEQLDLSEQEAVILAAVKHYTMTSVERQISLCRIIDYVVENSINGDFVECGVWRGGSSMIAALKFKSLCQSRKLWLYDTYEGMPAPDDESDLEYSGRLASTILANEKISKATSMVWAIGSYEEVKENLRSTGYASENIVLIKGAVEHTIPSKEMPSQISILRLDTDWYSSTLHELVHLYPLVAKGGFIIVDDYGHWQGARMAVDEFFGTSEPRPYLHRIDYTCRVIQKL